MPGGTNRKEQSRVATVSVVNHDLRYDQKENLGLRETIAIGVIVHQREPGIVTGSAPSSGSGPRLLERRLRSPVEFGQTETR